MDEDPIAASAQERRRMATRRRAAAATTGAAAFLLLTAFDTPVARAADAPPDGAPPDLGRLSIEELTDIQVSSVAKSLESLNDAPAAIYVITHDDIIRSGATTIPEILRLAPNLEVAQLSSSSYAISSRGFNGQLANKLLVLIDGRSVYSPLYAGVYWDVQYVLPEDIERIEVISGPGATLWGANAMNGVINIITRKAADTQGGVLEAAGGNLGGRASLQYGGTLPHNLTYRVYSEGAVGEALTTSNGTSSHDAWSMPQGGFRMDWTPPGDAVTFQGDIYSATEQQLGQPDSAIAGRNLLARWEHQLEGDASLQFLGYWDETRRFTYAGGGGVALTTYDAELQHSFKVGSWNEFVWGAGDRIESYQIVGANTFFFAPDSRTLNLTDVFAQDTMSLTDQLKLILGTKVENEPYSGLELLPSGRISWKVTDTALLWSAVSRAARAPTPFDRDLVEKVGATDFLIGGANFQPEKLTAFEFGTRAQPLKHLSFSISTFYNIYDQLRSIEVAPNGGFLPLHFGNMMYGDTYGVEAWATYQLTDWWRISAGMNVQHENLKFRSGSSGLGGIAFAGDDPNHQESIRSSMNLTDDITWDADLRNVGKLPSPEVPNYFELNSRLAWHATKSFVVSLTGMNLLHAHHVEFDMSTGAVEIPRSFLIQTQWRF
jgi:iron complex outermembrane recepter protein